LKKNGFTPLFILLPLLLGCGSGITKIKSQETGSPPLILNSEINLDLNRAGKIIDRSFYGSQLDLYSNPPAAKLIKDLGLGRIRIGGNEYDVYNWKTNLALTKRGLRQLIDFKSIVPIFKDYNVEGIFQINLHGFQPELVQDRYVLKPSFEAKDAFDLVKKLNGELQLKIVHLSLGNEFEQWHETHSHTRAWPENSGISAEDYVQKFIRFAMAIREAQESVSGNPNDVKIWGPEISASWLDWNTGNFEKDCRWSDKIPGQALCSYDQGKFDHFIPYFLYSIRSAEADRNLNPKGYHLLDYLSFHYYPNFRTKISDVNSIIKDSSGNQWIEKMLEATRVLHDPGYINTADLSSYKNFSPNVFGRMKAWRDQYYPNAKIALNEFAIDSDYRSLSYHPIFRPLYTADAIGLAATHEIDFFNNFVLNNPPHTPIPWTLLEGGIQPTSAYYTYSLFANHFLGKIVPCNDDLEDQLNCYGTLNNENLIVAIVNKSPSDQSIRIKIKNRLTKNVTTYRAPGWSTSILKIKITPFEDPHLMEVFRYGADEMGLKKSNSAQNIVPL
jgi:hypothetical protein